MFAIIPFDFDLRGRFITLRPGPNSRVTNPNVYENRWRYRSASLTWKCGHRQISGRGRYIVPEWL